MENTDEVRELADPAALPDAKYAAIERQLILHTCMHELPARHARLINLRYQQERTLREIADEFGVCDSAVHAMHRRILERIRKSLAEHGITRLQQLL